MRGTHTTEKYIPSMKKFRNDISKFKSSKGLLQEGTCYEKTEGRRRISERLETKGFDT